ncbi:MAG: DUF2637 domain-containing protein [Streptosporangiaceae bacterium]
MNLRRVAAVIADTAPVLVLTAIAGAGPFSHIRDTAAQHGQGGPMAWAVAVCIDLTCVMAARVRQRDRRLGNTRRLSWPTLVLAGGVLLSLAANLAQAQPTTWGRIAAATPSGAFLVAVSMLERRANRPETRPTVPATPSADVPPMALVPVPSPSGPPSPGRPAAVPPPSRRRPAAELVEFGRRVADEDERAHGQPITRDRLCARLGVSNQLASTLLRELRTT